MSPEIKDMIDDINIKPEEKTLESEIDLEKIPEEMRDLVKQQMDRKIELEKTVSNREMELRVYKEAMGKVKTESVKPESVKPEPDIIAQDDYYYPMFKKMQDKISVLEQKDKMAIEAEQKVIETLNAFQEKHPDWRTYETEMNEILRIHPVLKSDLPLLYKMGKGVYKQKKLQEKGIEKHGLEKEAEKLGTESSGAKLTLVEPTSAKTVKEAYEAAEAKLAKTGKK